MIFYGMLLFEINYFIKLHCFSMSNYFIELTKNLNNDERNGIFAATKRGKYIETHAYPDAIGAEANLEDDNTFIDDTTNNFDM